jgi:two-component system sensor histidine kinase KdpD
VIQQQILMEKQEEQLRGSLLRSISHDLRTPLTSILGASGFIMENGERMQPELRRKLLKDINEEAHWLLRMIENVLSVTKIGNHNTKLKKMLEPVEEVVADSIARCKKYYPDLKIDVQQPDELIMVPMDPVLIRQVLTNLIDNAHRHGKSNQKIELAVTLLENWLEISVQDYGPGMSAEDLQHVFRGLGRRKQQEQDSNRGLGLGVSICKTIVEAHDGRLMAENVPDKGLKVTFRLPVGEED